MARRRRRILFPGDRVRPTFAPAGPPHSTTSDPAVETNTTRRARVERTDPMTSKTEPTFGIVIRTRGSHTDGSDRSFSETVLRRAADYNISEKGESRYVQMRRERLLRLTVIRVTLKNRPVNQVGGDKRATSRATAPRNRVPLGCSSDRRPRYPAPPRALPSQPRFLNLRRLNSPT
jgi:hypothetical protein